MFNLSTDAWANVVAVIMVLVAILSSITRKLTKRNGQANFLWYLTEISSAVFSALLAWQMYPSITFLPAWITHGVFTALATYSGTRFVHIIQDRIEPK